MTYLNSKWSPIYLLHLLVKILFFWNLLVWNSIKKFKNYLKKIRKLVYSYIPSIWNSFFPEVYQFKIAFNNLKKSENYQKIKKLEN